MTAAAFGIPIILAAPIAAVPIVVAGWLLVGWSRVALGHHYVFDIILGTILGGAIAGIAAMLILQAVTRAGVSSARTRPDRCPTWPGRV